MNGAARDGEAGIRIQEQQRIGVEEQLVGQDAAEPDAQILDAPPLLLGGIARQVLDQGEPDHHHGQAQRILNGCQQRLRQRAEHLEKQRQRKAEQATKQRPVARLGAAIVGGQR